MINSQSLVYVGLGFSLSFTFFKKWHQVSNWMVGNVCGFVVGFFCIISLKKIAIRLAIGWLGVFVGLLLGFFVLLA